jgi:hypothetical protein
MKKEQLDDRDTDSKIVAEDWHKELKDNYGWVASTRIGKIWSLKEG